MEYSGNDCFQALLNAIVSKQVSVVAAGAIWKRMEAAGFTSPKTILTASDDELGSAAFSRKKIDLSEADIDYQDLRAPTTESIVKTLTKVSGIGVWTAEIYVIFSLGRAETEKP